MFATEVVGAGVPVITTVGADVYPFLPFVTAIELTVDEGQCILKLVLLYL